MISAFRRVSGMSLIPRELRCPLESRACFAYIAETPSSGRDPRSGEAATPGNRHPPSGGSLHPFSPLLPGTLPHPRADSQSRRECALDAGLHRKPRAQPLPGADPMGAHFTRRSRQRRVNLNGKTQGNVCRKLVPGACGGVRAGDRKLSPGRPEKSGIRSEVGRRGCPPRRLVLFRQCRLQCDPPAWPAKPARRCRHFRHAPSPPIRPPAS